MKITVGQLKQIIAEEAAGAGDPAALLRQADEIGERVVGLSRRSRGDLHGRGGMGDRAGRDAALSGVAEALGREADALARVVAALKKAAWRERGEAALAAGRAAER